MRPPRPPVATPRGFAAARQSRIRANPCLGSWRAQTDKKSELR
jgi:hypothetical protein